MTAAPQTTRPPHTPAPAGRTPPTRRRRRWHRVVLPFALVAALVTTTLVTRALDRPDPADPGYLSPVDTDEHGGSRLAEALRRRGVTVQRETSTLSALLATRGGPATLFVPAPDLLHPDTLVALTELPAGTRLVLVDPSRRVLDGADLPLRRADRRWATRAVGPATDGRACPLAELAPVREAAAQRQRYTTDAAVADLCFSAGLARLPGAAETVVAGADDPFRNDRIGERDNQAFATALLGVHGRVVWLDLDGPAPPPSFGSGTSGPPAYSPTPGDSPGDDGPGGGTGTGRTGDGRPGPAGGGTGDPSAQGGGGQQGSAGQGDGASSNPLWDAFPLWFWALLVQLALALLLAALWRARRLGAPTPEPLPVTVRSAETVLGRARLYQQAEARGPAARTLRTAALTRLLPRLNLPADAPPDRVAAAVSARTGDPPDQAEELLYGDDPASDAELLGLSRSLDRIVRTVAGSPPDPAHPAGLLRPADPPRPAGPAGPADPPRPEPTEGGPR